MNPPHSERTLLPRHGFDVAALGPGSQTLERSDLRHQVHVLLRRRIDATQDGQLCRRCLGLVLKLVQAVSFVACPDVSSDYAL